MSKLDFSLVFRIWKPYVQFAMNIVLFLFFCLLVSFLWFFVKYHTLDPKKLETIKVTNKYYDLMRWLLYDIMNRKNTKIEFSEYGFTCYVGRQGAGKTVSMVEYLHRMKKKYPECLILTNFECSVADQHMEDWRDLMTIRNGVKGVIFAIDEIHSEYSSDKWKDFPESLLSEISQQRKQRIKIVATSQRFARVAKPIREQCFSVVHCSTMFNRITATKEYDADDYETLTSAGERKKIPVMWHNFFVQSNALRNSYDTYQKIERMSKDVFIPRSQR